MHRQPSPARRPIIAERGAVCPTPEAERRERGREEREKGERGEREEREGKQGGRDPTGGGRGKGHEGQTDDRWKHDTRP